MLLHARCVQRQMPGDSECRILRRFQCSDTVSGDFQGPVHRYRVRGPCPQGHGPLNQVLDVWWRGQTRRQDTPSEPQAAAFVVATRTADRRQGSGSCDAPQRAAERRLTGTEDRRQSQGGGGASYARGPTGTEGSSTGGAAGHPAGAQAAEKRPQPAALLRRRPAAARLAVAGKQCERGLGRFSPRLPPLSVAGGEEARGAEEERGGGEGGPLGLVASPWEGQGRTLGLDGPRLPPHSSPVAPDGGARGGDRSHQCLEAWLLLGFFFHPEEEEKEEEAVKRTGLASPHPILGAILVLGVA